MDFGIVGEETGPTRPLWLVAEPALEAWRAGLSPEAARWTRESGFRAEAQRLILLPGAGGEVAGAAVGLGKAAGPDGLDPWCLAAAQDRLPPGAWRLVDMHDPATGTRLLLGWAMARYRFDAYRDRRAKTGEAVSLVAPPGADVGYVRRAASADALARDLINTPAGDMGPEQLSAAAGALAARHGAGFREIVGDALLDERLDMIHAVGRAGPQPPRLIEILWGEESHPGVTLVGKGVCFDSGGLDLKTAQGMLLMKKDMGGAACALGLASLVMSGTLPCRLRVLVPAVENSVDSRSYRPGDVLRSRRGLTVEVGNTDAEGRLVLADALALAGESSPAMLLDLATLTGAARVALGPDLPALFANGDSLARDIESCAAGEHDPVWRLPLWAGYDDDLASKVADLSNMAGHAFAGSIIGALFLQRFVPAGVDWAHLDLFAWNPKERPGRPVGAQAQCIRGLYRMLQRRLAPADGA
jgi:leucyl aminopeptidase